MIAADAGGVLRVVNPAAMQLLNWSDPPVSLEGWPAEPRLCRADGVPLAPESHPLACALRGESGQDELLWASFPEAAVGRLLRARYGPLSSPDGALEGAWLRLCDVTESSRLQRELAEHRDLYELRGQLMADVGAKAQTPELIRRVLERIHERFPDLRVAYSSVDEGLQTRIIDELRPETMPSILGIEIGLTEAPGWSAAQGARGLLAVRDVESEKLLRPVASRLLRARIRALLCASVRYGEALSGLLALHCPFPRDWDEHEVATFRLIADYLSLALMDAHREQARVAAQRALEWSILHDRLTGLANRALFTSRLEQALVRVREDPSRSCAVFFLDFDHFKFVNDSLGHEAGDRLLIEIANRLRGSLSDEEIVSQGCECLPARLGGDEFVLLLEYPRGPTDAEGLARRVQQLLSVPHHLSGHEVTATASIGIVIDDGQYEAAEHILRDADTAMYHAKERGKARHVVFDPEMHAAAVRRLTLERELRHSVERGEFIAHYQPIVDLRSGNLVGFESLLRWAHPSRGLVPPGEFIPLAEEIGLIVPMGEWILAHATGQLREWRDQYPSLGELTISVNVSKRQIVQPGLVECVSCVIRETGLPPAAIKLEITESVVMDNPADAAPVLHQLEDLGVQLAMDDFGTGHSSLGTLQRFPIHVLKVDRSFVNGLEEQAEFVAITQAIVTLAHSLRMTVVAEGVEKREQLEALRELECDEAQGFYLARPMSTDAAGDLLQWLVRGGVLPRRDA